LPLASDDRLYIVFIPGASFPYRIFISGSVFPEHRNEAQERPMLDAISLFAGLGFFALMAGYAVACDRI
jgi:hypothetical protein